MPEVTLKPCGHCGGKSSMRMLDPVHCAVGCADCSICTSWHDNPATAADHWNRRALEPWTSVVRWVRYTGTSATRPESLNMVFFVIAGKREQGYLEKDEVFTLTTENHKPVFRSYGRLRVGEIWAYLPEPPEGMGNHEK